MVQIKFDVSGQDPAESVSAGEFVEAPKGVYVAKVEEINSGYSKDESGKPDKKRPRLEVIYKITGDADGEELETNYSRIYDYVSFSDAAKWKLDQFLQTFGIASAKKRKGTFKTDDVVGQSCKIRVAGGKDQDGDYRARIGATFPIEDPDAEEAEEAFDEDEELGDVLTEDDINAMKGPELKELVKEHGIKVPSGSKVADVKALLIEALIEGEEEDWEDEGEEDDDDVPF